MIIISAGFRKSGSTLIHDYQVEVLKAVSKRNGQSMLEKFSTGKDAAYRGRLDWKTFLILLYVNLMYGDVVLKTHGEPTFYAKLLTKLKLAKVTYSYRDPRDVALSMLDHGNRTRSMLISCGESLEGERGFRKIYTLDDTIPLIRKEIETWYKWKKFKDVFFVKYEEFIPKKPEFLRHMMNHLNIDIDEEVLDDVIRKYENLKSRNFNKGTTSRFKSEMSLEQKDLLNSAFREDLVSMKYSLESPTKVDS